MLPASLAVCLLNPYHVHAFELPSTLSCLQLGVPLDDPLLQRTLYLNPFSQDYLLGSGINIAGWAYCGLIALGLVSFWLNRKGLSATWTLLWLCFLALSLFHVRLIPFFAIVAGPCLARNLEDWLAARAAAPRRPRGLALAFWEGATVWCAGLLLVLSWPGWLQGKPFERRELAVVSDPALEGAARQVLDWRYEGVLTGAQHTFNYNIETAPYLAWLGTENSATRREQAFLDTRLQLFSPEILEEYNAIRRGLRAGKPRAGAPDWRALLRKKQINRLILSDGELGNFSGLLVPLMDNKEWVLLGLQGRVAVLGWRDPKSVGGNDPWQGLAVDEASRGFHPPVGQRAPQAGPGRFPRLPAATDPFLQPRPVRNPDRDQAAVHLDHFDFQRPAYGKRNEQIIESSLSAALFGLAAPAGNGLAPAPGLSLGLLALNSDQKTESRPNPDDKDAIMAVGAWKGFSRIGFLFQLDEGPVGFLYQGIRAARRAIKADPEDAQAWLLLGELYMRLQRNTHERFLSRIQPRLSRLRHVQAVTAFRQAALLQPSSIEAQRNLVLLYGDLHWVDLTLKHHQEFLRLTRKSGLLPGESTDQFNDRMAKLEGESAQMEVRIKEIEADFEKKFPNMNVLDRVQEAINAGMGGLALKLLLDSDVAGFGAAGMDKEMELLLFSGHAREVKEWISPEHIEKIGQYTLFWYKTMLDAALGDYRLADDDLIALFPQDQTIGDYRKAGGPPPPAVPHRDMICLLVGRVLLDASHFKGGLPFDKSALDHQRKIVELLNELRNQADLDVFRGLLALESGARTEEAKEWLRRSLRMWGSPEQGAMVGGLDFLNRPLALYYLRHLEAANPGR